MVCVCCCPAYFEQDIDCIQTEYTQIVIELSGFGPAGSSFCTCPNGAVIVADIGDALPASFDLGCFAGGGFVNEAFIRVLQAESSYSPVLFRHTFAPGVSASLFEIRYVLTGGGDFLAFSGLSSTVPESEQCQSCASFITAISGETYVASTSNTSDTASCTSGNVDWYLQ